MANPQSTNVVSGKPVVTGGVLAAPIGSTLPTDVDGAVDAAFIALGYVSEDGVTKSETRETTEIKEWGGKTVKVAQTSFDVTYQFSFLEYINGEVAKTIYGDDNVTIVAAGPTAGLQVTIAANGEPSPKKAWVFDMIDGDGRIRVVIPNGQITETGETSFTSADAAVRDVTVSAFPDDDGVLYYEYSDNGTPTVVVGTLSAKSSGSSSSS